MVHFDALSDRKGGCAAYFEVPEDPELSKKYGNEGAALAACGDPIVETLDTSSSWSARRSSSGLLSSGGQTLVLLGDPCSFP